MQAVALPSGRPHLARGGVERGEELVLRQHARLEVGGGGGVGGGTVGGLSGPYVG
jgi:hypothetical protein